MGALALSLATLRAEALSPDLDECIELCNKALNAADKRIFALEDELQTSKAVIAAQDKQVDLMSVQITQQERELNSIWRNPFVIGAVGVILGVVIGK